MTALGMSHERRVENESEGTGHDLILSENASPARTEGSRGET
jgi:hypothetical protein